jgi:hypothetical protein
MCAALRLAAPPEVGYRCHMTRHELVADFGVIRDKVARYFEGLPLDELYRREGDAWAPVDDLRHLTLSMTAVTRGLSLPGDALAERFGTFEGPTRSRSEVGRLALAGLAAGGRSTEALTPAPVAGPDRTETYRQRCLDEWRAATEAYLAALSAWRDDELDRYQLAHPFLGMFNLREWGHFNALHALHHMGVAERRLGRGAEGSA